MVLAKIALFAALLAMAWLNHRGVHGRLALGRRRTVAGSAAFDSDRRHRGAPAPRGGVRTGRGRARPRRVHRLHAAGGRRGLGAASLEEITRVLTPGWPRLEGPTLAELQATSALGDPDAPRTPEEKAWSEFGHNVSGLFILTLGVARHPRGDRTGTVGPPLAAAHRRTDGLRGVEPGSRGLADRAGGVLGAPAEPRGSPAPAHAGPHRALRDRGVVGSHGQGLDGRAGGTSSRSSASPAGRCCSPTSTRWATRSRPS